jgi:hypothetical protein
LLSGAVFYVFVCAVDIPYFLNFFVPEVVSDTEVYALVVLILIDVIEVSVFLLVCDDYFICLQNVKYFQVEGPVVPYFFDAGV